MRLAGFLIAAAGALLAFSPDALPGFPAFSMLGGCYCFIGGALIFAVGLKGERR